MTTKSPCSSLTSSTPTPSSRSSVSSPHTRQLSPPSLCGSMACGEHITNICHYKRFNHCSPCRSEADRQLLNKYGPESPKRVISLKHGSRLSAPASTRATKSQPCSCTTPLHQSLTHAPRISLNTFVGWDHSLARRSEHHEKAQRGLGHATEGRHGSWACRSWC